LYGAPLYSLQHILSTPIPPPDWEIEPLVTKGQRVMIFGQWGAFKTWFLQDLALALCSAPGIWLKTFPISSRRNVLYLDKEMSLTTAKRRLQRLALGRDIEALEDYPFQLCPHPNFTMNVQGGQDLLRALDKAKLDPDVIFFETFRRMLKGAENDQESVSAFWDKLDPLFKAGKTLYISHHMRKPKRKNEQSRTMASGNTDILAGADGVFALDRDKEGTSWLEHLKNRDGQEYQDGKALGLKCQFLGEQDRGPVVWTLSGPLVVAPHAPSKEELGKRAMLAFMTSHLTASTLELAEAARPHGAQRTVEGWIKELKTAGKIISPAKGTYHLGPIAEG
jgi:hypothetical protein